MAIVTVNKYTINALSLELEVPYGTMWNAVRRFGILNSCERESGGVYLIDSNQMRELRRAANISRLYRIGFDKAVRMLADGFRPPRNFDTQEGVA